LDNIAGLIIGSITGETGSGAVFFAERFDELTAELTDYANKIGENMNWMAGAMMSVLMTVLVAVLSGAAALMLVLSKMVVTLLIGIAPVMIPPLSGMLSAALFFSNFQVGGLGQ
jgi:type IV secretion system protein VirB6